MTAKFISAKYDVSTLSVDYGAMNGTNFLRTGGTIAWRFNNPGNIRPASEGKLILGAIAIGITAGNKIAGLGGIQCDQIRLSPYVSSGSVWLLSI